MTVLFLVSGKRCNPQSWSDNSLWKEGRVNLLAFGQPYSSFASLQLPKHHLIELSEGTDLPKQSLLASRRKASPNLSPYDVPTLWRTTCHAPLCWGCCWVGALLPPAAAQGGDTAAAAAEAKCDAREQCSCRNRAARHAAGSAAMALGGQGLRLSPPARAGSRRKRGAGCLGSPRGAVGSTLGMMVRSET